MFKNLLIVSLILIEAMVITDKTIAMLQEDELRYVSTLINSHTVREQSIDNFLDQIEQKSLWVDQHTKAYNATSCGGESLMCQRGACKVFEEKDAISDLKRQVFPILKERKKYHKHILYLKNLRLKLFEVNDWINTHGQASFGADGNCTSSLCNAQCQAYVPFMLTCLLPVQQVEVIRLTNKVRNTLDVINTL